MPKSETKSAAELLPRHFKALADELIEVHGKEGASAILQHAGTMIAYPGAENMTGGLYMAAVAIVGGAFLAAVQP